MRALIFIIILIQSQNLFAQDFILDSIKPLHEFINWDANVIKFADSSEAFQKLYKRIHKVSKGEEDKIHIFHIGGSHIQADLYTHKLRSYLQFMSPSAKSQRGFVFPYHIAKTNNPLNYRVEYDGEWEGYRCSKRDSVAWGLSGITAKFKGEVSNIKVKANHKNYRDNVYQFNKLRIFYDNWGDEDYVIKFSDPIKILSQTENKKAHFKEFQFDKNLDSVSFSIERIHNTPNSEFLMMGLELMNDDSGIEYTSIGVNGASFKRFDRCVFFEEQLKLYKPDLFIISLGTNDTYTTNFNSESYRNYYKKMMDLVLKINPEAAILLTVPNDSYYRRKYPNPFTKKARAVIYDLSKTYNMAVWDLYDIMGGLNSSQDWYENDLMAKDKVHFSIIGYSFKADIMLEALTKSIEQSLNLEPQSLLNQIIDE